MAISARAFDPVALPASAARAASTARRVRTMWVLGAVTVVLAALTWGSTGVPRIIDPATVRLMHGMTALKIIIALPVAAAIWWRLGRESTARIRAAYFAASWSLFSGPAVLWGLRHPLLPWLLFDGSLIVLGLIALADSRPVRNAR